MQQQAQAHILNRVRNYARMLGEKAMSGSSINVTHIFFPYRSLHFISVIIIFHCLFWLCFSQRDESGGAGA